VHHVAPTDVLAFKNVHTRLVIDLMHNPWLVVLASFVTVPNNFYNEERDRFVYLWSSRLSRATLAPTAKDPTLAPRNRTLEIRCLHVETTIEIICTNIAAFVILSFGISLNGRDPPSVEQVALNSAIQFIVECVQSLISSLYYVVVMREPVLSVPLLRVQGFSLIISCMMITVWSDALATILPIVLGRRSDSEANWVLLTEAFLDDLNSSALCAAVPQAVGFAESCAQRTFSKCP
jgi:hypothetical protein